MPWIPPGPLHLPPLLQAVPPPPPAPKQGTKLSTSQIQAMDSLPQVLLAPVGGSSSLQKGIHNNTPLFSDLAFPELALDSHLIPGGSPFAATQSLMQQLGGLHSLLQVPGALGAGTTAAAAATAAAHLFPLQAHTLPKSEPLAGTTIDNPLQSKVIGTTGIAVQPYPPQQLAMDLAAGVLPSGLFPSAAAALAGPSSVKFEAAAAPASAPLSRPGRGGRKAPGIPRGPRGPSTASKAAPSSHYRGVTKHKRSGRFEAHIWIKELGRQVYLGGYECEEHAGEAYDIAALKSKGPRTQINFDLAK